MFIWDFVADTILEQIMDWVYKQIIGFLANFFAEMGNMGAEMFEMSWVQSIVLFFSYLAWILYAVGFVVACAECGLEYSSGRADIKGTAMNLIKGFMAVSLFTVVPIRLYELCVSLQANFGYAISGAGASFGTVAGNIIDELTVENFVDFATTHVGGFGSVTSPIMVLFCIILMAYAVIKVFFANLKRGGILLIQIAVGSLYMFSVPRGYLDGFYQWCKQVVGLCLTAFLQATILIAGLSLFNEHALLGLGLMLSAGAVNALRREGLTALEEVLCAVPERHTAQPEPLPAAPVEPVQPLLTCSLQKPEQLTQALADCRPEMIYLPVEWLDTLDVTPYLDRTSFCAVLPRIFRTEDEAALREMLVRHRQVLAAVAVSNLGHLPIAEGLELPLRGDLGMNVFNSRALLFLRELGLSTAAVSFELRHQQIRDLKKYLPCEAVVYGRLPLMLMENCVIANSLGCCDVGSDYRKRSAACRCTGENVLTDRTGARFPLMPAWGHRNELENSRTLFLADKPEWRRLGLTYARLRFTTESPAECVAALQRYQGQGDYIPADLTRGLFYRGVE